MKMTHLKAKELFKKGKINEAWEVVRQDEGLVDGVEKFDWIKWMGGIVAREGIEEAAYLIYDPKEGEMTPFIEG